MDSSEAEKLAVKEGCLFFEVSAKTNENIKKMFYSVVVELPYFTGLKLNKMKLINDLENENNESKLGDSYINTAGIRVRTRDSEKGTKGCNC